MSDDRNEILVGIVFDDSGKTFVLSKVFHRGYDFSESGSALHMLGGYQTTGFNSGCYISVGLGKIAIDSVYYNGKNIIANAKYFVAYR